MKKPRSQEYYALRTAVTKESVAIIGAGGVGRQIALQLVALGVPKLTIIDPGLVKASDVPDGGFRTHDVGQPLVDVIGDVCHQANPQLDFTGLQESFHPALFNGTAVFCCVERTAFRKVIWLGVEKRCRFWGDVRVNGETARVFVATDEPSQRRYAVTLGQQLPKPGRKHPPTFVCVAGLAASLAVHQYTRHLRGLVIVDEVELDLPADRFEAGGLMHE